MTKRLFLLDAYALIYRAYYALIRSPRTTTTGLNTSAIFGFCNALEDVLRKENPTHIAVCFDPAHGHTFRHDVYPEYKAGRDKQPEDITLSLPYIKRILEAYRIPVVEVDGYEADDVIGTLSRHAEAEGFDTYMMTPDKDYGQLVTDRVFMYRPALRGEGFEIRGPQQVCERYGIESPRQVIDLLALEGDASDNIPGCPGVGEKTAAKLIGEYGSVENLLNHTDDLKGALQKRVVENSEQIRFSKMLATIKTDVPLPEGLTVESLERKAIDVDALAGVYRELEFRSFLKKLEEKIAGVPAPETPKGSAVVEQPSLFDFATDEPQAQPLTLLECPRGAYRPVADIADAARLVERALKADCIGLSVNSVGEEAMTATVYGLAIAIDDCEAVYLPMPVFPDERRELMAVLEPLFSETDGPVIADADAKRDMIFLRRENIRWTAKWFDTTVAGYLLDSEARNGLPDLMARYLKLESPLIPETKVRFERQAVGPIDTMNRFCQEADSTRRLVDVLRRRIADDGMTPLLDEIEMPTVGVLAQMEWNGVRVDPDELNLLRREYAKRLEEMEQEAYRLAGTTFNVGSPTQVGELLFGRLNLDPKAKKTSRGAYSTTEAILEKYRAAHPVVGLILDIRKLRKLVATYLDTLPTLVNPKTGKIHTTFNQTVTATGRISSTNPNLQNIPVRSDDGREIRRAFIADPGCLILSADYSQIELRLIADLSQDPDMTRDFVDGHDIHQATAARIYRKPLEEVTPNERRNAKTANFGIIYGISAFGLSERLGIPRSESKQLIEDYFATYPKIKEYLSKAVDDARERGFVETAFHRRRHLPEINSRNAVVRGYAERNAVNAPLQGTAADIIKRAMVDVQRRFDEKGLRSQMIMQVHDELIFNVVVDEITVVQDIVTESMRNAYSGRIPLEVSVGIASNWLQAH